MLQYLPLRAHIWLVGETAWNYCIYLPDVVQGVVPLEINVIRAHGFPIDVKGRLWKPTVVKSYHL